MNTHFRPQTGAPKGQAPFSPQCSPHSLHCALHEGMPRCLLGSTWEQGWFSGDGWHEVTSPQQSAGTPPTLSLKMAPTPTPASRWRPPLTSDPRWRPPLTALLTPRWRPHPAMDWPHAVLPHAGKHPPPPSRNGSAHGDALPPPPIAPLSPPPPPGTAVPSTHALRSFRPLTPLPPHRQSTCPPPPHSALMVSPTHVTSPSGAPPAWPPRVTSAGADGNPQRRAPPPPPPLPPPLMSWRRLYGAIARAAGERREAAAVCGEKGG